MTRCFLVVALLLAADAAAQTIPLAPPDPARWDVSASLGWLSENKEGLAEDWNDWSDSMAASIEAGHYWTPHLKLEVGGLISTDGTVYSYHPVPLPGERAPLLVPREHHFRLRAASASIGYQFFENTWVHPFVAAGVQAAWERERSFPPHGYRDPRLADAAIAAGRSATAVSVLPFVAAGIKFYVGEAAFIRTDVTTTADTRGIRRVLWRTGLGMDF